MHRHGIPTLLLTLCLLCSADPALAACNGFAGSQPSLDPPFPTLPASYDPTRPTDTVATATITVNPATGMSPPCSVIINIPPSFEPGLAKGASYLAYGIASNPPGIELPSPFGGIQFQLQNGFPQTFTLSMVVPNRQNVLQGTYSEQRNIRLYANGATQPLVQTTITYTAQVIASCTLPAPNLSTLNFSAGILNGRVTNGYTLTSLIQGASCSGPARLVLRGTPMQTGATVPAGFDNRIYYQATARLGAATTILNVDAASEALATLPATSGTVSIGVALVDKGKIQAAGTYSSVLSVVLEPSN